ncbi:hypothetical protein ECG_00593 [Echinococcus granulosus]|nr:hypothetical protein ECG_00593 [Echinococcus granulosus]
MVVGIPVTHLFCLAVCVTTAQASTYEIQQESYPVKIWWQCQGVPNLQTQKVKYLEEATKAFYLARLAGKARIDRDLADHVPPASILNNERYMKIVQQVIEEPQDNLGSQLMMRINCELFNDLEWVQKDYDIDLSRNTNGVRGLLDIIYRIGLCVRGIDKHLNCPDPCRTKGLKFCRKAVHSIGICGAYVPEELRLYAAEKEEENAKALSGDFRRWHAMIPPANRMPISFFEHFVGRKELFVNAFEAQLAALKVPYCICEPFYTANATAVVSRGYKSHYDRVKEVCVEDKADYACGGGNPCMNGGECQKALQTGNVESSGDGEEEGEEDVDQTNQLFVCKCLPAFRGDLCENDFDPCAGGTGVKTCQPFKCVRVPEDPYNGFKCLCPPKTHKPKNPTEPVCVPIAACKSGDLQSGPCRAGGRCEQLPTGDPLDYKCHCPPGYGGRNCEDAPPDPYWSSWSSWGLCKWPRVAEACFQRAYQECTRQCIVHSPGQVCQGPGRRIRYRVCDLNSDDEAVTKSITPSQKKDLQVAFSLCALSSTSQAPGGRKLEEASLLDPMRDLNALDDWANAGPEEATYTLLPAVFRLFDQAALEAVNWPSLSDLVYLTGWIYACILLLALVFVWTYLLRVWILRYYGVDVDA